MVYFTRGDITSLSPAERYSLLLSGSFGREKEEEEATPPFVDATGDLQPIVLDITFAGDDATEANIEENVAAGHNVHS